MSKANAYRSVVSRAPSSGVAGPAESSGVSWPVSSARCDFARSRASAVSWASLVLDRCLSGATVTLPEYRSTGLAVILDSRRGSGLVETLARLFVGVRKLLSI